MHSSPRGPILYSSRLRRYLIKCVPLIEETARPAGTGEDGSTAGYCPWGCMSWWASIYFQRWHWAPSAFPRDPLWSVSTAETCPFMYFIWIISIFQISLQSSQPGLGCFLCQGWLHLGEPCPTTQVQKHITSICYLHIWKNPSWAGWSMQSFTGLPLSFELGPWFLPKLQAHGCGRNNFLLLLFSWASSSTRQPHRYTGYITNLFSSPACRVSSASSALKGLGGCIGSTGLIPDDLPILTSCLQWY